MVQQQVDYRCWRAAFIFFTPSFDNRPRRGAYRYEITVLPLFLKEYSRTRSFACDNDRKGFLRPFIKRKRLMRMMSGHGACSESALR